MKIKFKRFTKPQVLKRIGRDLLVKFLARFPHELAASQLPLPPPDLSGDAYFQSLARLLMAPEALANGLNEALFAIDEMATPDGQQRLQLGIAQAGLQLASDAPSTPEDLALKVWLAAPDLLARVHNEQRLLRLTAFYFFGPRSVTTDLFAQQDSPSTPTFAMCSLSPSEGERGPSAAVLESLAAALDRWFARNRRGQDTTRIEVYPIAGEFWFMVRHGDTFTRAPKVERQKTEVLHFRPEKDDVIVYSPQNDELRINARTKGERELYARQFGNFLRGNEEYFSERHTYTLEPLRAEGPDALHTHGLEGICQITLRELEIASDNGLNEVITRTADDLFQCIGSSGTHCLAIPSAGRLVRAAFVLKFDDSPKPRPLQIRPPNLLKLGRHCDARIVDGWLSKRGFRIPRKP